MGLPSANKDFSEASTSRLKRCHSKFWKIVIYFVIFDVYAHNMFTRFHPWSGESRGN
jgi:hypothetical protein